MHRFLFDLVFHNKKTIETNELLTTSVDGAIDFIDNFYLELHAEGAPGPDDTILHYALHLDAVATER